MDHTGQHVQLIETALEGLRRTTGLTANITRLDPHMVLHQDQNQRFDTFIEIQAQHRKYQFAVEAKLGVRTELLTQIRALWPHNQQPPLLVVALYITTYLAENYQEIQLHILDTAGNAYLAAHQPLRFRAQNREWAQQTDLTRFDAYWGGEMAADRLTHYLKPEMLTIYTRHNPTKLIAEFRLRADVNGDIEMLDAFWDQNLITGTRDVVPPILAYADLMTTPNARNLEAAKLI